MLWLAIALSISLVVAGTLNEARAQATITVASSPPSVSLDYNFSFHENVTALSNATLVLNSSNSSQPGLVSSVQSSMQRLVPGVVVDPASLKLVASVRQQAKNSTMWIMSEDLSLSVTRAISNSPGESSYNMSFIAMNVSDSLRAGKIEFNNVGPTYLLGPINTQSKSITFYLDRAMVRGGPYLNPVIPGLSTQNFNLLDFSWIPKVSEWSHTYRPLDSSSTWTLNPGTDRPGLPYNLTMGLRTPEGSLLTSLTAFYNLDLSLTTPERATADRWTISYPVSTSTDFVMPSIVAAVVILAAATFLAERRILKPLGQFKKKRKG